MTMMRKCFNLVYGLVSLVLALALVGESIFSKISWAQQAPNNDPRTPLVRAQNDEAPVQGVEPPGDNVGSPGIGNQPIQRPMAWDTLRVGYGFSGAVRPGNGVMTAGTGYDHGGMLGSALRYDGSILGGTAALHMVLGNRGLNYISGDLRPFNIRFRVPVGDQQWLWAGFAPQVDFLGTTSPNQRNRFGVRLVGLFGVLTPMVAAPANQRGSGVADRRCVFHLFPQAGLQLFGFGQTQDNNPLNQFFHPIVGAEVGVRCQDAIYVDLTYLHIFGLNFIAPQAIGFNGVDVNRVGLDLSVPGYQFPASASRIISNIGAYLTASASHEIGNPAAALDDPTRQDRVFLQAGGGINIGFDTRDALSRQRPILQR